MGVHRCSGEALGRSADDDLLDSVVPSGAANVIGQPRLSNAVESQYWLCGSPMIDAPLGIAWRYVPQWQLSRAIRPAQRTWVIVAPGGAVKAWPEWLNPE